MQGVCNHAALSLRLPKHFPLKWVSCLTNAQALCHQISRQFTNMQTPIFQMRWLFRECAGADLQIGKGMAEFFICCG